jgi:mevalonate kinase
MVKASAPGKVHLIGEHAVVYGEPAILASIGKRIWVEAEKHHRVSMKDRNQSVAEEWDTKDCIDSAMQARTLWLEGMEGGDFSKLFEFVKKGQGFKRVATGIILHRLNIPSGVRLNIYGDIPRGSGLGSSAALAVALVKAISELYGHELSLEQVNELAFDIERFVHGTPSGGDNTACCYGGLLWFQKGKTKPTMESLREEIPYTLENFVLTYIKKPPKSTGELVSDVRKLEPGFREPRVKAIGDAAIAMRKALREKDFKAVKDLINLAWKNLSELGLSIPEADRVIGDIRQVGGAAKLCGACGGGIMLAYHEDKALLKKTIRDAGYSPWETELGTEGVKVD